MKVTLTRHTKDHQLRLSTKTVENFLERISKDDPRKTVTKFRYHLQFIGKAFIETEYMEGRRHQRSQKRSVHSPLYLCSHRRSQCE